MTGSSRGWSKCGKWNSIYPLILDEKEDHPEKGRDSGWPLLLQRRVLRRQKSRNLRQEKEVAAVVGPVEQTLQTVKDRSELRDVLPLEAQFPGIFRVPGPSGEMALRP